MKLFSTILNIVLLIAVGVLYFLHFSSGKKNNYNSNALHSNHKENVNTFQQLAYVELDSINNNVSFIKIRKKELESEQKLIMNEYENACRQQEIEKNNFIKRGSAISQEEAEVFQSKWLAKQQDVETTKQSKGQRLAAKGSKIMEDMQTTLKDILNDYNKDKRFAYIFATGAGFDYLFYKDSCQNITADIVKGLNDKMSVKGKQ
jgi:outer membrane protein